MNLLEEAVIIEIFGVRVYAFGLYVMIGTICSMITLGLLAKAFQLKPGTAPLSALLAMVVGVICSRLVFCLLNQELGQMTPVSFWPQLAGGGWSMFGLVGGVFLGGWAASRIMKEKTAKVLDFPAADDRCRTHRGESDRGLRYQPRAGQSAPRKQFPGSGRRRTVPGNLLRSCRCSAGAVCNPADPDIPPEGGW